MNPAWRTVKLGDVVEVASGQVDPGEQPYCDMPHIGGDNIESDTGKLIGMKTAKELHLISGKYAFDKEHVLYSKIRPALNKVVAPDFKGICSADIYPIRPLDGKLCREYLVYLLRSKGFYDYAAKHSSRTNIPKINRTALLAYEALLPPVSEQRRIAAILDKANAIRRKREQGIRLTEGLLHSTFQEMFGDPATNPKGWEVTTLGTITDLVTSGLTPTGGSTVYVEEGPIFIRSQNVLMNRLDLSDVACLPKAIHESMSRTKVHEGDVLLNITGASIGRVAWVNGLSEEANVNQHVCIIRLNRKKATPEFVSAYISLPFGQRQIDNMQSGASRQGLNHQQVRSLKIPLPPFSLQQRYSKAVTMLRKVSGQREQGRLASEELFNSLVQRAFRGDL